MGPYKYLNLEMLQLRTRLACTDQRFIFFYTCCYSLSMPLVGHWWPSHCPSNSMKWVTSSHLQLLKHFTKMHKASQQMWKRARSASLCLVLIPFCLQWQSWAAPPALQPHVGSAREAKQSCDNAGLDTHPHPHHAYRKEYSTTSKGANDRIKTRCLREK